ncbi:hypothetical protein EC988_006215 [Linderina pennispora]|nr:hypothetical protein EC988_006215 [Linderina pennispora]
MSPSTNPLAIGCPKPNCRCTVLRTSLGELVQRTPRVSLPAIGASVQVPELPEQVQQMLNGESGEGWFWRLTNMMDFENVGFSKRVDGVQYLSCADCDLAPIGYHDTQGEPKEFLVSVNRVKYRE